MARQAIALALLAIAYSATGATVDASVAVNPIRRVVTMLQMMQNKITAEGKKETKAYDAFMCWCKNGADALGKSISDAETKVTDLESSIKEAEAAKATMESDLSNAKQNKEESIATLQSAKALRAKEAAAFAKETSEFKTAIAAIEKGATGSFLQTSAGVALKRLVVALDM